MLESENVNNRTKKFYEPNLRIRVWARGKRVQFMKTSSGRTGSETNRVHFTIRACSFRENESNLRKRVQVTVYPVNNECIMRQRACLVGENEGKQGKASLLSENEIGSRCIFAETS